MTLTKLKTKNQITIPSSVIKRMGLKLNEYFVVEIRSNFICLTPVHVEPKYSAAELKGIDKIVHKQMGKGKSYRAGPEFSGYLKGLKH